MITYNYLCSLKDIVQTQYPYIWGVYILVGKYILGKGGRDEEREKGKGEKKECRKEETGKKDKVNNQIVFYSL